MTIRALRLSIAATIFASLLAAPAPAGAAAGFGDVPNGTFYTEPVQWMVDNGITSGTAAGCFSPSRELTRAEIAVFLWRYAGEPAGGSEPFADVPTGAYFQEAVAWMVANGITAGTSATTFHPNRTISRAEVATFIWRFMGRPNGGSHSFNDVGSGQYFSAAVAWMAKAGITTGTTPTTFSPYRPVTRAEIATFLWRLAGEPATSVDAGGTCGAGGGSTPTDGFETLGVGAALPSGEWCAAHVRQATEVRPDNADENATRGSGPHSRFPRVDGDFVGTTDEILQWAACKWGIDEDIVRAQAVKESYWHMSAQGDVSSDQSTCHWSVSWMSPCPQSLGILQVRFAYHAAAFDSAAFSTAYNADYTYAVWRSCFDGNEPWLNNVERGAQYAAGDVWGCLGVWFAGRWYTPEARGYIDAVDAILADRTWESAAFINHAG